MIRRRNSVPWSENELVEPPATQLGLILSQGLPSASSIGTVEDK